MIKDARFLSLVDILKEADVTYTHLETLIHDYDGPEVYSRVKSYLRMPVWEATPADVIDAHELVPPPLNPPGGYRSAPVLGAIIAICSFTSGGLTELKLYPVTIIEKPPSQSGLPVFSEGDSAREIIAHLEEMSSQCSTEIEFHDGFGFVKLSMAP